MTVCPAQPVIMTGTAATAMLVSIDTGMSGITVGAVMIASVTGTSSRLKVNKFTTLPAFSDTLWHSLMHSHHTTQVVR